MLVNIHSNICAKHIYSYIIWLHNLNNHFSEYDAYILGSLKSFSAILMYFGVKQNQGFEGGKERSPEAEGAEAGSACGPSCLSQPVFNRTYSLCRPQQTHPGCISYFSTSWSTLVECRNTSFLVDGPYLFMNISLFSLYALQLSAASGKLKGRTEAEAVFLRASRHWCLSSPLWLQQCEYPCLSESSFSWQISSRNTDIWGKKIFYFSWKATNSTRIDVQSFLASKMKPVN